MILIVNVCCNRLSSLEFVKPVEDIVKKTKTTVFVKNMLNLDAEDFEKAEKTVICGTALKDFGYLDHLDRFEGVKNSNSPILGICAGMQIIMMLFGGRVINSTRIGRNKVKIIQRNILSDKLEFYSYFLNSKTVEQTGEFEEIAVADDLACIVKHRCKRLYGCLFHPEVLNPEIITNFILHRG